MIARLQLVEDESDEHQHRMPRGRLRLREPSL